MRICPHLNFNGDCRTAFGRYQEVLGGNITTMLSYGESPLAAQYDARWHERILHAALVIDDEEIIGTDQLPDGYKAPQGMFVTVTMPTVERARAVFDGLAEGGSVMMPFQSTFWTAGFGVLIDAFGVGWEINCSQPTA